MFPKTSVHCPPPLLHPLPLSHHLHPSGLYRSRPLSTSSSSSYSSSLPLKFHRNRSKCPLAVPALLFSVFLLLFLLTFGIILSLEEQQRRKTEEGTEGQTSADDGRRRFRRQTVPADNVLVYATNSNVSVADQVQVLSAESHIRLMERHLNATVWSNASLLQMSPNGDQLALSASRAIALALTLSGGAQMQGTGETLQLNGTSASSLFPSPSSLLHPTMATSVARDVLNSRLEAELTGRRVNLSWADPSPGAVSFLASNARVAAVVAMGWARPEVREEIRVLSAPMGDGSEQRELSVVANSPEYQVQIRLVGAETSLNFRGARLDISPDHRSLLLRALGWRVVVQSLESPFELLAAEGHLRVNCFDEAMVLDVRAEALELHVGQQSRLLINRSMAMPGRLRVNGGLIGVNSSSSSSSSASLTDRMELASRELRLSLSRDQSDDQQSVLIDATNSHLRLSHANRTTAALSAARHFVEMLGGKPLLGMRAGNVSVQMEVTGEGEKETEAERTRVDTDIVPEELRRLVGSAEDSADRDAFGIGPFPESVPAPGSSQTIRPSSPTTSPGSGSSSASSLPPIVFPTVPTLRMAAPGELFTFRQSFAPSASPLTTSPQLSNDSQAFPSPAPELFTFPPSSNTSASFPSDSDFLVGQFDTLPPGVGGTGETLFPISATISTVQFPAGDDEANQFPGIRRENLLIWRPEDIIGPSTVPEPILTHSTTPETYSREEQKRRKMRRETTYPEEKEEDEEAKGKKRRMELEMDIVVEGEEDVRAERLRRQLGEGMERMLEEEEAREEEGRMMREEGKEEEQDEGTEARRKRREGGGMHLRVSDVQLEQAEERGGSGEDERREVMRVHFTLEGDGPEVARAVGRVGRMDTKRVGEALGHEVLSLVLPPPSPSSPPSSSTLAAISAHSLPALLAGSLALALALLTMLVAMRPMARAISKVQQWWKMNNERQRREEIGGGQREHGARGETPKM